MKRFIVSALCVSVFFLGLGTLIEKVGAKFKSDERALELIRAAKTAIGGDNAIAGVQSLRIKGTTTNVFKIDGTERSENGETEIALQLPDKLSKRVTIGKAEGETAGDQIVQKRVETVVVQTDKGENQIVTRGVGTGTGIGTEPGQKRIIIQKQDGTSEDLKRDESGNVIVKPGDKKVVIVADGGTPGEFKTQDGQTVILRNGGDGDLPMKSEQRELHLRKNAEHETGMRQNELFRLTLGLLLSPPTAMAVNYTFGGEVKAADRPCNLVIAEFAGSSVKLYLDRDSNLPVMMTYTGEAMPVILHFNKEVPAPNGGDDKNVVFFRTADGPASNTEYTVRFDDYRSAGGVQLPYRWVTTGGDRNEVFTVTSYEVNPADIANSFQDQKVMLRVKKDGQ